jgi:hypothetical protein
MTNDETDRLQKLNDVREMLDWLEARPDVPLPQMNKFDIFKVHSKEDAIRVAAEFGEYTISNTGTYGELISLDKNFGQVQLSLILRASEVCEPVEVQKTEYKWVGGEV